MTELATRYGLTLRQDYFGDPSAWGALVDLLQDTFSIDVDLQASFGGPDPTSMPSGYFDGEGRCVANFSAFSMPMIINGRAIKAAGYQSGAVRPEWRERGLYRDLMQRAFDRTAAEGCELDLLLTDKPALYERYGFRSLPQHIFGARTPKLQKSELTARQLSLEAPDDLRLIKTLLQSRQPVSARFAVVRQMEMFLLNACFNSAIRLTALGDDAVIAWTFDGATFWLLDIAGTAVPSLATILSALDVEPERIEICFSPDRLDCEVSPEPYEGYTVLMARGKAADEIIGPLMLSPMAEF
ncbi:GNAT family N-acetyltransferase [Rhizobium sp. P40RR-XXII]|uniref:GNAT family N-acetyltransferase n=1 Tax=unclassified Rhizobium TaxID=2613769 RepID=UPI0014567C45|nr:MULTISPECIES: GNAT family N-acetyltransferase [unclassified Rhizobium]NLR87684.1 GNAT family N-acetyltransferase [Rhizobium sp. P28RR-XV]NLS18344.1 GNAT family N-acetyltransferase [Rhizobium sp. P40RR-XXII]